MITDGITSANINNSKYLFIIVDGSIGVDDDVVDSVVVPAAFCILNPKINDDVPIKKETIVRTFCVRPGMMATGAPRLVCCCVCCCCCCALTVFMSMHMNDTDSKIIVNVNKNKHNVLTRLGNNPVMISVTSNNSPTLLKDTETH
jgi:hypothetical protein